MSNDDPLGMAQALRNIQASGRAVPAGTLTEAQLAVAANAVMNRALRLIEQAQNDLCTATAELSKLEGCIPEWEATSKMADKVKAHWHRVRRVGKFKLDRENARELQKRVAETAAHNMPRDPYESPAPKINLDTELSKHDARYRK